MQVLSGSDTKAKLNLAASFRALGPDDLSDVRYVHGISIGLLSSDVLRPEEIDAFRTTVRTPEYAEKLLSNPLIGAFVGPPYARDLIGTVSWQPSNENNQLARIRSIFVRPFFTRVGIGSALLAQAEKEARQAGFSEFGVGALNNAVGFFNRHGYVVTSYGTRNVSPQLALPLTFMRKSDEHQAIAPTAIRAIADPETV